VTRERILVSLDAARARRCPGGQRKTIETLCPGAVGTPPPTASLPVLSRVSSRLERVSYHDPAGKPVVVVMLTGTAAGPKRSFLSFV
jgi:hypothetical protein